MIKISNLFVIIATCYSQLLRLGRYYQFDQSINLTFHCSADIQTILLIQSDEPVQIEVQQKLRTVNQPDTDLTLYISDQCLQNISIKSAAQKFKILQREFILDELNYTHFEIQENNRDYIHCYKFNIEEELLFIIHIDNLIEQLSQFHFILTSDTFDTHYPIQQVDEQNFYQLLKANDYSLFVVGPNILLYRMKLSNQQIVGQFIRITQKLDSSAIDGQSAQKPIMVYLNIILEHCYIEILSGSAIINSENKLDQQQLVVNSGMIVVTKRILHIIITSNNFIIFYKEINLQYNPRQGSELILFDVLWDYEKQLKFPNYVELIPQPTFMGQLTFINIGLQKIYHIQSDQLIKYQKFVINYISLKLQHMQDVLFLIPKEQKLMCSYDQQSQLLNKINGDYEYQNLQDDSEYIVTKRWSVINLSQKQAMQFTRLELNQIYKINQSQRFIINYNQSIIYVNIIPYDLEVRIYRDEYLKEPQHYQNSQIQFQFSQQQSRYIVINCNIQFYYISFCSVRVTRPTTITTQPIVIIGNTQLHNYPNDLNNINFISPYELNFTYVTFDQKIMLYEFHNLNTFISVFKSNLTIEGMHPDEFQLLKINTSYIIYTQYDNIVVEFSHLPLCLQLEMLIQNTDLHSISSLKSKTYNFTLQQDYLNSKLHFNISEQYLLVDLSFFQCQEYDCVLSIKVLNFNEDMKMMFRTCVNLALDIVELYTSLFICQSLEQIDILPLQGTIKINRKDRYIICESTICYILFKQVQTDLEMIQSYSNLQFSLQINKLHSIIEGYYGQYLIYNNQSQLLQIYSNHEYEIKDLNYNNITTILDEGYYIIKQNKYNDTYITIFNYPTILYDKIVYRVSNKSQFTVLKNISQYLFFQSDSIDLQFSYDDQHYEKILLQQLIPLENIQSGMISLIGEAQITGQYIQIPCYFVDVPKLQILHNGSLHLSAQLNQDCRLIEIQLISDISKNTIQQRIVNHQVDHLFQKYDQYHFHSHNLSLHYQIRIISEEYSHDLYFIQQIRIMSLYSRIFSTTILFFCIVTFIILKIQINKHHSKTIHQVNQIDQVIDHETELSNY